MAVDKDWHRTQIDRYTRERPRYEAFAKALEEALSRIVARHAPKAIVQARAKTVASFAEKAVRKAGRLSDPVSQLRDLCGARVIAHTQAEVDLISDAIQAELDIDWAESDDTRLRLGSGEFGYRSVHYCVRLRPSPDVPEAASGLWGEVQVRTLLQHAWADISHDRLYKTDLLVPEQWRRTAARLAAVIEDVDSSFQALTVAVDTFADQDASYLTREKLDEEMETLEAILASDDRQERIDVALRLARIARAGGQWGRVVTTLERFPSLRLRPDVACELGQALFRRGGPADVDEGRKLLEHAVGEAPGDPAAAAALGRALEGVDDERARALAREASELAPRNPYYLASFIDHEVSAGAAAVATPLLAPMLRGAIEVCRTHVSLGLALPHAWFTIGRFAALLGDHQASLGAYLRAVAATLAPTSGVPDYVLGRERRALDRLLGATHDASRGAEATRLLLRIAEAVRAPEMRAELGAHAGVAWPVLMSIDGDAATVLLAELFANEGTLLHRRPEADDEVALGAALEAWAGIVASGVEPRDVRVVSGGGSPGALVEARVALALGAPVTLLVGTPAEALLSDPEWASAWNLSVLPVDPTALRLLVAPRQMPLPKHRREALARELHATYLSSEEKKALEMLREREDRLRDWEHLSDVLRDSNLQSADYMAVALAEIDCIVVESAASRPFGFSADQVERLAILEHGRWLVEKAEKGFRPGPRDDQKKRHPGLVPWSALPQNTREQNRDQVRAMPATLAKVGLEIRRKGEE